MSEEIKVQFADEETAEQAYADAVAMVDVVRSLCVRLEQANERIELLQSCAGCASFSELMAFVQRHADDGK